jgi:hypothetical protein
LPGQLEGMSYLLDCRVAGLVSRADGTNAFLTLNSRINPLLTRSANPSALTAIAGTHTASSDLTSRPGAMCAGRVLKSLLTKAAIVSFCLKDF